MKHVQLTCINEAGGYSDFEGTVLAVPGLVINVRLSVPTGDEAGDDAYPYLSLHIGDENDAYRHHNGEPETFRLPWAATKCALAAGGHACFAGRLPNDPPEGSKTP